MPKRHEEDYFAKIEREKKEKLATELKAKAKAAAKKDLEALHYHCCGKCGSTMETTMYRGVEIEVCPDCGAVLLDQGELEQLAGEDTSGVLGGLLSIFGTK